MISLSPTTIVVLVPFLVLVSLSLETLDPNVLSRVGLDLFEVEFEEEIFISKFR